MLTSSVEANDPVALGNELSFGECTGDAAAHVCAFLLVQCGWGRERIAHAIGLPPLVIQEAIKNNTSSVTLRRQLCNWLSDSMLYQQLNLPRAMWSQLQDDCAADELKQYRDSIGSPSSPLSSASPLNEYSPLAALDPLSRQHFTRIQKSVGHSFISILSYPTQPTNNGSDWTAWAGTKLSQAFDFHHTGGHRLEELLRTTVDLQSGPDSSAGLLASYPPTRDFSGYVQLISEAYQTNRKEGLEGGTADWRVKLLHQQQQQQLHSEVAEEGIPPGKQPWPSGVPSFFFVKDFDVAVEVQRLSEHVLGDASGTAVVGLGEETTAPVITSTTFLKDFEYLEGRNRELRTWESSVEGCLLQHVKRRSEDFFVTSLQFEMLGREATSVLTAAQESRRGGMHSGECFIRAYLHIGMLYRRRENYRDLRDAVETVRHILRQLADVENWAALPERDLAELSTMVAQLIDLETIIKSSGASSRTKLSWAQLSSMRCLVGVPGRLKVARRAMEEVVAASLTAALVQLDPAEWCSAVMASTTALCAAATRLGVLKAALQLYIANVAAAQEAAVQEQLVTFFMNSGCFDDQKANELLSVVGREGQAGNGEVWQQLSRLARHLDYDMYTRLLREVSDHLVDMATRCIQSWLLFITESLPKALALYENKDSIIQSITQKYYTRLFGDAEAVIASLVEVCVEEPWLTDVQKVEEVARLCFSYTARKQDMLRHSQQLLCDGWSTPSDNTGEVVDLLYKPTKVGLVAVQHIAKKYFRNQHARNIAKLTLLVESETWTPMNVVEVSFQTHVDALCSASASTKDSFTARSITANTCSPENAVPMQLSVFSRHARRTSSAAKGPSGSTFHSNAALSADGKETFLDVSASKLYVLPDRENDDGRVANNSLVILLEVLYEYHEYLALFPFLGYDVVSRMVELLESYASLVTAMLLGARAVERGTLQTITIQNLCVGSQSVAFLSDFVPLLQQHLLAVLCVETESQAKKDFQSSPGTSAKLLPLIKKELHRVTRNCCAHRDEFFSKMGSLIYRKVESLDNHWAQSGAWMASGNEWVMTMLKEVARLMRVLRPLLPAKDVDGVLVPLLGSLSVMLREATQHIPASSHDDVAAATSDVTLFRANVEKFGYDVLLCANISSPGMVMQSKYSYAPCSDEEVVMNWFFHSPASPRGTSAGRGPLSSSPLPPAS